MLSSLSHFTLDRLQAVQARHVYTQTLSTVSEADSLLDHLIHNAGQQGIDFTQHAFRSLIGASVTTKAYDNFVWRFAGCIGEYDVRAVGDIGGIGFNHFA